MNLRSERIAASLILVATFLLFFIYSAVTPLFEASDELWHYPLVQHLATTAQLPVQRSDQTDLDAPWRQEGSQPPLYYAMAALVSFPFDTSSWRDLRRLNPHSDLGRPTTDGNLNSIVHTEAERFPWSGSALAIHIARLLSVIFSTITVLFAYLVAIELFPYPAVAGNKDFRAWLRLAVMSLTATIPMFAFISGSVNNDNAAAMFATVGLWYSLQLARKVKVTNIHAIIAGLIAACAALSKSSTLGLLGLFGLSLLLNSLQQWAHANRNERWRIIRSMVVFTAVMLFTTALLAGWWFLRNQQLYGDWLGWNSFLDAVGRRNPPATLQQLWSEREGFVWAFWGVFGTLNVVMPHGIYDALNLIAITACVGSTWSVLQRLYIDFRSYVNKSLSPLHSQINTTKVNAVIICSTWVFVTFIALLRWTSLTPASQGRLLFPCISVFTAFIAYGCFRISKYLLVSVCIGFAILAFTVPFVIIQPAYAKPLPLSNTKPDKPLGIVFGTALELIGFDSPLTTFHPGASVPLNLYWHANGPLQRNYSVFVHLLNEDDVVIGQRDMYPGQGSIATTELRDGYTWMDHYDIVISPLTPGSQQLHFAVGLYDLATGERLSITNGVATEQGVELGTLKIEPAVEPIEPQLIYGNGIMLSSYELSPLMLARGFPLTVTLHWTTNTTINDDVVVSLQVLDDKSNKIAQNDSAPASGAFPTTSWKANQVVEDTHVLDISRDAAPGLYRLLLVLYHPMSFDQIGTYGNNGIYIGNEVELTKLRVR